MGAKAEAEAKAKAKAKARVEAEAAKAEAKARASRLRCFYTQTRRRTGAHTRRLRLLSARTKLRTLRPPCARRNDVSLPVCLHVVQSRCKSGTVLNTVLLLITCKK